MAPMFLEGATCSHNSSLVKQARACVAKEDSEYILSSKHVCPNLAGRALGRGLNLSEKISAPCVCVCFSS